MFITEFHGPYLALQHDSDVLLISYGVLCSPVLSLWSLMESYEVLRSHMDSCGVFIRCLMESLETYGVLWSIWSLKMESYGILQILMQSYGVIWIPVESFRVLWSLMESYGVFRVSWGPIEYLESYGVLWSIWSVKIKSNGVLQIRMQTYRVVWIPMESYRVLWSL